MSMPRWSVLAVAALALAGAANAQTPPIAKVRQACMADKARLCPDLAPGHGAVGKCVRSHISELSPDCKSALMARMQAHRAAKAAAAQPAPAPN